MHGMWWGSGPWFGGPGMGFLWPLVMPVFLGALVALAVGVMRRPSRTSGPPQDSAMEILRTRYAKGEINQDEFEAMRRDLTEM
jgi:putative membrane protein